MSVLASLARAYERLDRQGAVPPFGYSTQRIGFVVSLNEGGSIASVADLRGGDGKKVTPRMMDVPVSFKRPGTTPRPFFLWDNTAFVLGVSAAEGKDAQRRQRAFRESHLQVLDGTSDSGLLALRRFLDDWTPDLFTSPLWPDEMKDQNVVFALESERRQEVYLHDRPAARNLWSEIATKWKEVPGKEAGEGACLVTGKFGPIARTHLPIKGIRSSGGKDADSIVSFNEKAYESYGHEQGDNAPVSELAAFKYTSALNALLASGNNRIQIGDTSTVFWADASNVDVVDDAETFLAAILGSVDESDEARKIKTILERIRKGIYWADAVQGISPGLAKGVRSYVLGLSPNAARLSIRFWFEDSFGVLAENYQRFVADMTFEPIPVDRAPMTIRSCAIRTAPARRDHNNKIKFDIDQVSPLLAGELSRAMLTGSRFPGALLAALVMRIRTDHFLDSIRVSLIKAALVRNMRLDGRLPKEDYLVRSDPDDPNPARRLGRLFALIERAQLAALGDEINTTVKDRFLGAAATTPQQVFGKLVLAAEQHHIKRLRNGHSDAGWIKDAKQARNVGEAINRDIGRLWATFTNGPPAQHSNEEQGLFLVGYYQERFGKKNGSDGTVPDDAAFTNENEE